MNTMADTFNRDRVPRAADEDGPPFGSPQVARGCLALVALRDVSPEADLVAWVDGVEIGRRIDQNAIRAGQIVEIPCHYFPNRELPCEVRIGTEGGVRDAAPGLILRDTDEVEALVGPGTLDEVRLKIVNGVLEGTAVNARNGLGRPPLVCRVNGHLLRYVDHVAARKRDSGGAYLTFRMPLGAADITADGVTYELLQLPNLALLGSYAFTRRDATAASLTLVRLNSVLESLSKRLDFEMGRLREECNLQVQEMDATLEGVMNYILALASDEIAKPPQVREAEAATAFRKIAEQAKALPRQPRSVHVRPSASYFVDGWFEVEIDNRGYEFRWMGLEASLLNPNPSWPVASVTLTIGATARPGEPQIEALFDAEAATVRVLASSNGAPYTVEIVPHSDISTLSFVLYLRCGRAHAAEPAMTDKRVLTLATLGATWRYSRL